MYLHEYQSKQVFARFGISITEGSLAQNPQEARRIAEMMGVPVVVNAQALASRRVFRLAATPDEAEQAAHDILDMTISGVQVRTLLIEPAATFEAEYFLGIYSNRGSRLLLLASTEGGSEISQIERDEPQTIVRETINPFIGVRDFQTRNLANGINLAREHWDGFTQVVRSLYRCCLESDAVRGEINPLALTPDGRFVALGGKLIIDDNARFRQPELDGMRDLKAEHESVVGARAAGISYVQLEGTIGCIASGAGLGMATIDGLARHGEAAAGLFDLGSDISREKISVALRLILPEVHAAIINIFAEKASCDLVAQEIAAALVDVQPRIPIVIRLAGQNADEGHQILSATGLSRVSSVYTTRQALERLLLALEGFA